MDNERNALEQEEIRQRGCQSECSDLLIAETAGANQREVQVRYRLPIGEKNPYTEGTPEYVAFHRGYELEAMIGG